MKRGFHQLTDTLQTRLRGQERFLACFSGERSEFVRFNHARVRQAMHVEQRHLSVHLIDGRRHITAGVTLSGHAATDEERLVALVDALRERLPHLPEDPYLMYATDSGTSERIGENRLPDPSDAVGEIMRAAEGLDFVGLYAAGGIFHGFASSLGQRNWFESYSHNLDWSLYHDADKAVKTSYAGFTFDSAAFSRKMQAAREQLGHLATPARTIEPGAYRVYLTPAAMEEIVGMICWGGFGLKDHRTKQTPLIRMVEEGATLHRSVTLSENTGEGVAADFQSSGFLKPPCVPLIDCGALRGSLVSPRSAQEYDVPTNGASDDEMPESLDMAAGDLPQAEALDRLATGLYINNLHYLNFSDRTACRMTGMTRFATFWVEKGKIVAPVNVMRFDETLYRVLGENLVGLTRERDMLLNPLTYGSRSTASTRLPGALIDGFTFTL